MQSYTAIVTVRRSRHQRCVTFVPMMILNFRDGRCHAIVTCQVHPLELCNLAVYAKTFFSAYYGEHLIRHGWSMLFFADEPTGALHFHFYIESRVYEFLKGISSKPTRRGCSMFLICFLNELLLCSKLQMCVSSTFASCVVRYSYL